jgi:hypothetical protein
LVSRSAKSGALPTYVHVLMADVSYLLLITLLPVLLILVVFGIYCVRSCPQFGAFPARATPVAAASSSIYEYPMELGYSPRYDMQIGDIETIPVRERRRSVISSFTATLQTYFKNISGNTHEITPFSMHLHYSKITSCTLVVRLTAYSACLTGCSC